MVVKKVKSKKIKTSNPKETKKVVVPDGTKINKEEVKRLKELFEHTLYGSTNAELIKAKKAVDAASSKAPENLKMSSEELGHLKKLLDDLDPWYIKVLRFFKLLGLYHKIVSFFAASPKDIKIENGPDVGANKNKIVPVVVKSTKKKATKKK